MWNLLASADPTVGAEPWSTTVIVLLYAAGIAMLLLEVTIPGGVVGAIGGLMVVVSIYMAFDGHPPALGYGLIGIAVVVIPIGVALLLRFTMLLDSQRPEDGYVAGDDSLRELIGMSGTAMTKLRPSGSALIAGRKVDVVTQGQMVDKDGAVVVTKVEGQRVEVRPA